MGADREVGRVELVAQRREVAHGRLEAHVDAAVQDPLDLGVEALARQAVARDAVAQHAAEVLARLEDRDLVAHDREVVGAREAGRTAAHDGDALAGRLGHVRAVVALHVVDREALEAADVHGVVHHAAAAVHLAGVLAHVAADERQRVVLADEAHGLGELAGLDQRDVAGDVDACRAARHARHELALLEAAGAGPHVVLEVVAKAQHGLERHLAGLVADGAVAREVDGTRGLLDQVDRGLGGRAVEHALHQVLQHVEPHAARRALAAALRGAHAHERRRELHGTRRQRAHREAPADGLVQVVHDDLRLAPLHDVQSCH